MVLKQRLLTLYTTFTDFKSKKNLCMWITGFVLLVIFLPYVVLVNHSNNKKINALYEDLQTLKNWMSARNLKSILKSDVGLAYSGAQGVSSTKRRKKRDVGKGKEQEHGPKSPTYTSVLPPKGGAVYIRWGRTTCPENDTELVYDGIAGGSWHDHYGSATNLQCLPNKPDWGRFTGGGGYAYMYDVEYEEAMDSFMDMSNVQSSLTNHNAPCVVCRSSIRTSILMIPAKNVCFEGWHLEYNGYLMAGHHGSKSGTQYICVDESPEADPAGYRNEEGALLYRVTVQCGSLPCPRYVQDRELVCVVCTK